MDIQGKVIVYSKRYPLGKTVMVGKKEVITQFIFGRNKETDASLFRLERFAFVSRNHGTFQRIKEGTYTYTDTSSKVGSYFRPAKGLFTGLLTLFGRAQEQRLNKNEPIGLRVGDEIVVMYTDKNGDSVEIILNINSLD